MKARKAWMESGHHLILCDCLGAISREVVPPAKVTVTFAEWCNHVNDWRFFEARVFQGHDKVLGTCWKLDIKEKGKYKDQSLIRPNGWDSYIATHSTITRALGALHWRFTQKAEMERVGKPVGTKLVKLIVG